MYKVLIVDDMVLIRKGLQKMIDWEALNLQLIGEAENGTQALEMINKYEPNIVITDIRMPKTNGIELIKTINNEYPHIITIVISGYDDFQYAQQAIKNGSLDYILKPINPTELNATIKKACSILSKKKADENNDLKEHLLRHIHNLGEIESLQDSTLSRNKMFCAVIIYDKYNVISIKDFYERVKNLDKFIHVLLLDDANENLFIFYSLHNYKTEVFQERIFQLIKQIMGDYKTDKKVIIGIGDPSKGVENINKSYETAREVMLYGLLEESTSILCFKSINRNPLTIDIDKYEDELLINVTSGNLKEVNNILDNIKRELSEVENASINSIRLFLSNLCHIILRVDSGLSEEIQDFLVKINNLYYFLSFDNFNNVLQILNNLYIYTTKKYMVKNNKKESIIMDIQTFIEKNYSSDIGLSYISELYHMNSSYLSNLFKKETGVNINQFITKVRIDNAKKILKQSDVNIKELANMVGYSDYTYFYRVFKKMTGMTPKQYQTKK